METWKFPHTSIDIYFVEDEKCTGDTKNENYFQKSIADLSYSLII